ncbi:4'-phosphopantetheinyl transferase superfamily protein [Azospirillum sp. SYSU D00513]|uniref:4'-phosphopantetheinyl transferase family protein n=1 Tax=Azospirillum sp. SYSU D00513 TaxID=2812561 RepID=UPI001A974917|nr:4'-phosphopantetheinyl transferase superfamily protein [Azospirillum sp. SYSU D00513]
MLAILLEEDSPEAETALRRWGAAVEGAQRRSRVGRALLRGMLGTATGLAAEEWRIVTEASGRPVAVTGKDTPGPSVSLSHSGGWVAAAVCAVGTVGIDVEAHRPSRNFAGIARFAFGPEECARAAAGPDEFYRIWTLREAVAKATSVGITQVADRKDRVAEGPGEGAWTADIEGRRWFLFHKAPHPALNLALAVRDWASPAAEPDWWSVG